MANLPAGAVIVLTASLFFVISLVFGSARGLLRMGMGRVALRRKIMDENLLRDLHEWSESASNGTVKGPAAHRFEHFTDPDLQHRLSEVTGNPAWDPHRRIIPGEPEETKIKTR